MRGQLRKDQRFNWLKGGIAATVMVCGGTAAYAIVTDLVLVEDLHDGQIVHFDQFAALDLVIAGEGQAAFEGAFEEGDELFEARFNALDGVGANVGERQRFTRVPRADLNGPGEWANHKPARATGPNGQACNQCHAQPFDDGAGTAVDNVHRDPLRKGKLGAFIRRDTPHLFGLGALQRLAEEMTGELHERRDRLERYVCHTGRPASIRLAAKSVAFGRLAAKPLSQHPCKVSFGSDKVEGVAEDLIVRPYQWKGSFTTVRSFNRDASHNELGMQAVEIVGYDVDGDFDGVVNEMTVGDQTALAIYLAAQPRPTSRLELAELGLIDPLSKEEKKQIRRGEKVLAKAECNDCHRPNLAINRPVFSEPSRNPLYRDAVFPAGLDPVAEGVTPKYPISFDLTEDQPDNILLDDGGNIRFRLGAFEADRRGRAIVRLYGDLRRHDMGPGLAENIDEVGSGRSNFMTKELWGVGSTAPYLHDGRATTLTEAILEHGGEANHSRRKFLALAPGDQAALIAFLDNLVLFKIVEEE